MTTSLAGHRFPIALSISMVLIVLGAGSAAFPQANTEREPYLIGLGDILEVAVGQKNADQAGRELEALGWVDPAVVGPALSDPSS